MFRLSSFVANGRASRFDGEDEPARHRLLRSSLEYGYGLTDRIDVAAYLDLQRPNGGSVTDIAFRWGFCDAAHFSRVFKREFGATPSEIRQAALSQSA